MTDLEKQMADALREERKVRLLGQEPVVHWESLRDLRRACYERTDAALAAYASQQAEPSSGSSAAAPVVAGPSDARVEAGAMALAAIWEGAWGDVPADMKEGLRNEARAVLQAADAVSAGPGWMPIETAPRDGREFLCTGHVTNDPKRERFYTVVFWDGMFFRDDSGQVDYGTHWMPLPAAPGAEQKGGV